MNIQDLDNYNVNQKTQHKDETLASKQPNLFTKSLSYFVDSTIVIIIRTFLALIVFSVMYKMGFKEILEQINFESKTIIMDLYMIGFFKYIALLLIIVTIVGGFYYILFWSSSRGATLGCMIFKIQLIDKKTLKSVSIQKAIARYTLYILPVFFVLIILLKLFTGQTDAFFFILCLIVFLWYDFGIFLKIKIGVPDLLCNTMLISTKQKK